MKKEIFDQLIKSMQDDETTVSKNDKQPVIRKKLVPILRAMHPDVDFENYDAEKGARGQAWENILKYSGLKRIDFCLPGVTHIGASTPEPVPSSWGGYECPTISSVIFYKGGMTFSQLAEIIKEHYDADAVPIIHEEIGNK